MAMRVLVLDDDPDIARLERRILQHDGYEVTTARDGVQALADMAQAPPDLIVTNLRLLRRDGRAVRARAAAIGGAPPALLVSSTVDDGPPDLPYLRQPFVAAELLRAVARALDAPRS